MELDMSRHTLKMKSVKAACHNAPGGPWKDAALEHYQTAEIEHSSGSEAATNLKLDAATHALELGRSSGKRLAAALQYR